MNQFIEILGFICSITGIILLYFSSIPKPWNMQTWNGTTPQEKSYENRRSKQRIIGTILLVIGTLFMFSYTNKLIGGLLDPLIKSFNLYFKK